MFADTRILYRHGGCEVLSQQHVVGFSDSSALAMHPLRMNGVDDLWRRAIELDSGMVIVFDLRTVCPPIKRECHLQPARDRQGFVMHTLRAEFTTASHVVALAEQHALLSWWPMEATQAALFPQPVAA